MIVHDDEAGVLCECDFCTFTTSEDDYQRVLVGGPRCEDAPCCGCCEGGLL